VFATSKNGMPVSALTATLLFAPNHATINFDERRRKNKDGKRNQVVSKTE
jgi:hypothetical protein